MGRGREGDKGMKNEVVHSSLAAGSLDAYQAFKTSFFFRHCEIVC